MKTAFVLSARALMGLAAAALLSAGSASAQTASPFYAFTVNNLTYSSGDPLYSVYDSVNFNNLQVSEVFADSFTQSFALPGSAPDPALEAGDSTVSPLLKFLPGPSFTDSVHGTLTSATLTGNLSFPGLISDGSGKLKLTIQPTADPASQFDQYVFTSFSTNLFGPAQIGPAVGTFSLLNLGGSQGVTVNINAPVPEASTTVSLGILLALGLGTLAARCRKSAVKAG